MTMMYSAQFCSIVIRCDTP